MMEINLLYEHNEAGRSSGRQYRLNTHEYVTGWLSTRWEVPYSCVHVFSDILETVRVGRCFYRYTFASK